MYVKAENIATTKQSYSIQSLVPSDVLFSALDSHHVVVDYRSYRTLAEGLLSIPCTLFPVGIAAFRYLRPVRNGASNWIDVICCRLIAILIR